jgi:hypothetical protein
MSAIDIRDAAICKCAQALLLCSMVETITLRNLWYNNQNICDFPMSFMGIRLMRQNLIACFCLTSTIFLATPASALDLNSFRAQHHRPALAASGMLAGLAAEQARSMASRRHLDHANFRARIAGLGGGVHAENVAVIACARPDAKPQATFAGRACGCADEDCAFRMWAKSSGHRANMLRGDVSSYGLASASDDKGRRYWVLELGN